MELNIKALKQIANGFKAFRNESRLGLKEEIRNALNASNIQGRERAFIADYLMSQYGYGGGF